MNGSMNSYGEPDKRLLPGAIWFFRVNEAKFVDHGFIVKTSPLIIMSITDTPAGCEAQVITSAGRLLRVGFSYLYFFYEFSAWAPEN